MTATRHIVVLGTTVLLASAAHAAPMHEWVTFSRQGLTVQYPRDVFSTDAGAGDHAGQVLATADRRARLNIFTLDNDRRETPNQFLRRSFPEKRSNLTYDRVTPTFFAISESKGSDILYRRCNFTRDRRIHCIDLQYPWREKRSWDGIVTRVSRSLRPR